MTSSPSFSFATSYLFASKTPTDQMAAATRIKLAFHRHGSFGDVHQESSPSMTEGGENGTAEANESTHLIERLTPSNNGQPLYEDSRPFVKYPAFVAHITWEVLKSNYVNVLLVFVPLGIISGALGWNPTTTFILNFLAIIPLASLLSFATEEVAVPLGQTVGG